MDNLKVPPYSLEAEQSVLGSMLLSKDAIFVAAERLKSEDFYKESHRKIFEVLVELNENREPVDLITVSEALRSKKLLEQIGGITYLTTLTETVPTAANIAYYCSIVEEKALLRRLISTSSQIMSMAYDSREDAEQVLDEAERMIFEIVQKRRVENFYHIKDILLETFERIEELYNSEGGITGVPTGFPDLDEMTSGLQPSDLILIAARPSMGKTSFALNIAANAAIRYKIPVAIFSLEMSKEQLVQRLLCSESNVDSHRLRTGRLEEDDWPRLAKAMGPLSQAPIFIDDTPGITSLELRAKARRLKAEKGLGLIMIDYLQLMSGKGNSENRQQEISDISRSLKALARELSVPVVALSQLSRAPEIRSDHRPILSDLRESGSQEQDSDVVAFLYRDDYYNPDTEKKNIAEVIIAKQRNGPTGVVELVWLSKFTKFASIERFRQSQAG
ncbi:MAG: replicative helicase [Thermoanaerobacteraceae bacterium]|jgi:replicative DNA helicase|uniref:Replicative DNA helicase n=1 Tax=Biomaibacter acetigenes TaxID=2316383 RepID=A0A3G2R9H7_9FIRM|nr:replicative DNA helicase [Biomaibacter acetigenes]MDK2877698.1 replicative helicase [Thermoanaerobacteraceae bacterium]RKL64483.1 replicative DNA helicase [Thermoanaerobacteraceae bacterium SP2]AYO32096.1 replicative DNA helicase [Biomaibacter acetigenes]MDN5301157.1 replicative helicase [Thermoanaerobacteraceae bacterium]MDN5312168.1 replicative helicase [Thermoanaerobacteraceae bacterium]